VRAGALRLDAEVTALRVLTHRHDDAVRGAEPGERSGPRIDESGSYGLRSVGGPDQEVAGARRVDRDEVNHDRLRLGSAIQEARNGAAALYSSLALRRVEVRSHDVEEKSHPGDELSYRARRQRVHDAARLDRGVDELLGRSLCPRRVRDGNAQDERRDFEQVTGTSFHGNSSSKAGHRERVPLVSAGSWRDSQPCSSRDNLKAPLGDTKSLMSIPRIFASQSNLLLQGHRRTHDRALHDFPL
jgi:hypothetical protein